MLIVADVHLGKVMHFRKAGIPIPKRLILDDLNKLASLISEHKAERVLFLGDLFHSQKNSEWTIFEEWIKLFPKISFELVMGNHDLYAKSFLPNSMKVYDESLVEFPFIFTHEPLETCEIQPDYYNLSGHLHPAVSLKGKNGERIKLPCFYFGEKSGLLPAFGKFTSSAKYKFEKECKLFGIAGKKVIELG
ncbi:MAG: DNA ligase-associated metallophosphoesterase [Flammeovirgaceae bacterium]|jgi:DNA ligase-associated metallophosphoesterase